MPPLVIKPAKKKHRSDKVPAFSADGSRIRDYSRSAAEHLVGGSFASPTLSARGVILAIHFRDIDGGTPFRATSSEAQAYSFIAQIGQVRLWQLKALDDTSPIDFKRVVIEATNGALSKVLRSTKKEGKKVWDG